MNTGLKRLLAALPALCMLIALTACGGSQTLSKEIGRASCRERVFGLV